MNLDKKRIWIKNKTNNQQCDDKKIETFKNLIRSIFYLDIYFFTTGIHTSGLLKAVLHRSLDSKRIPLRKM